MILGIIFIVVFFALFLLTIIGEDKNGDVAAFPFAVFFMALIITIGCSLHARENKALYNDMAKNPQCYSINELKEAHKNIIKHKSYQGHWISFYNGYEFPEINVNIMDEVDTTLHIVK